MLRYTAYSLQDHSAELQRQRELRQQELAAVLSVKKHTQSLTELMEKVELSADVSKISG